MPVFEALLYLMPLLTPYGAEKGIFLGDNLTAELLQIEGNNFPAYKRQSSPVFALPGIAIKPVIKVTQFSSCFMLKNTCETIVLLLAAVAAKNGLYFNAVVHRSWTRRFHYRVVCIGVQFNFNKLYFFPANFVANFVIWKAWLFVFAGKVGKKRNRKMGRGVHTWWQNACCNLN